MEMTKEKTNLIRTRTINPFSKNFDRGLIGFINRMDKKQKNIKLLEIDLKYKNKEIAILNKHIGKMNKILNNLKKSK